MVARVVSLWGSAALWLRLAMVVLVAAGASVAWYLGSPLFVNQVVSEPALSASAETSVELARGQFDVVDAIHQGEGSATVQSLADGRRVLRFDEFRVTNGPDLYVYLSEHPVPRDSAQLHAGEAFEVARLKGNVGGQNYELPADLDLAKYRSVVIYCKRFTTVFSTATLSAAG